MVYASHAATGNHAHSLSPCVPPPGVRCARCVKPYAQHHADRCERAHYHGRRRVPVSTVGVYECYYCRALYLYRYSPGENSRLRVFPRGVNQRTLWVLTSGHARCLFVFLQSSYAALSASRRVLARTVYR